MSPVVLTELLSDPLRSVAARESLAKLPLLEISSGFWERAGLTRAELVRNKVKPKLADTLIAQLCIDHGSIVTSVCRHQNRDGTRRVALLRVAHPRQTSRGEEERCA